MRKEVMAAKQLKITSLHRRRSLDKEFDVEIQTNLLGITQQAIDGFTSSSSDTKKDWQNYFKRCMQK